MTRTLVACGPLPDSPSSYSTFAPSASVRKPSPEIPEKCTNASFPPSSGVMKPKPFSSLNHLTTPVARQHLLTALIDARGGAAGHCLPACFPPASGRTNNGRGYTSVRRRPRDQGGGATAPPPCPASPSPTPLPLLPGSVSGASCGGASYCVGSKPASSSGAVSPVASGVVSPVLGTGVAVAPGSTPVSPPVSD